MIDISGSGAKITIVALSSFPMGFTLSKFADDIDPIVSEDIETSGTELLYDGSLFIFDKAAPIKLTVGLIAGSSDDINCKILLQARKSNVSILPFADVTSAIITYPDGGRAMMSNGSIMSGPLIDTVQSAGRKKGNAYTFLFGSFAGAQSANELAATLGQAVVGFL
jgi:hypothetical protein